MSDRKIKMQFKDDENMSKMLVVDYPKDSYEVDEVKNAMDKIIQSNVLVSKKGPVTSKAKAYEEIVEKNEFELA